MLELLEARHHALVALGRTLRAAGYRFTTVTPATHACVLARPERRWAEDLRDVFGWGRPFRERVIAGHCMTLLDEAGMLVSVAAGAWQSRVRFATAGELVLAHSRFPTTAPDSVFFGPDTYRFLRLLEREAEPSGRRCADLGCGTGAAGLWLAKNGARAVVLGDVNDEALRLTRVNAELNDESVDVVASDMFAALPSELDLVVMNPPYLVDAAHRTYRDGGGARGIALALRFVQDGLARLAPGGRLILYTGAPIVRGDDVLHAALAPLLAQDGLTSRYEEIDPDVFGDELGREAYVDVERIAAVALVVDRR